MQEVFQNPWGDAALAQDRRAEIIIPSANSQIKESSLWAADCTPCIPSQFWLMAQLRNGPAWRALLSQIAQDMTCQ